MKQSFESWVLRSGLWLACGLAGCKVRGPESGVAGYRSIQNKSACVVENLSGRPITADEMAGHKDQLTRYVFNKGNDCPTTFQDVAKKVVRNNSRVFCHDNFSVALVSERAMHTDQPEPYRTVFSHDCSLKIKNDIKPKMELQGDTIVQNDAVTEDDDFIIADPVIDDGSGAIPDFVLPMLNDFMMAPLGAIKAGDPLPEDAEFIAYDRFKKVYNFYTLEGGQWRYFGNSFDMLKKPGTSRDNSFQNQERRCANCHTSGGLVQKELRAPWINWNGNPRDLPGAAELRDHLARELAMPDLSDVSGEFIEVAVAGGNAQWNETRISTFLKDGTVSELLEPLFCTTDFVLDTSGTTGSLEKDENYISVLKDFDRNLFIDTQGFTNRSIRYADLQDFNAMPPLIDDINFSTLEDPSVLTPVYLDVIHNVAKQKILDDNNQQLTDRHGKELFETRFQMIYPARSSFSLDYQEKLAKKGIVDSRFVLAVLSADLTMPIFSKPRCDLLKYAPNDLKSSQRTAKKIAEGFIKNLQAAKSRSPIEQQFLDDLLSTAPLTPERPHSFMAACRNRAQKDLRAFVVDVVKVTSQKRAMARAFSSIIEHNEMMPSDSLNVPVTARLDPNTCQLKL